MARIDKNLFVYIKQIKFEIQLYSLTFTLTLYNHIYYLIIHLAELRKWQILFKQVCTIILYNVYSEHCNLQNSAS